MSIPVYREHPPSPALAPHVECFWTLRSGGALVEPARSRVLPDGCVDLIFDFGDRPAGREAGDPRPRSSLVGAMTAALAVAQAGRVDLLGVRFRPGGAAVFLRLPLGEATDLALDVDGLGEGWGEAARDLHSADTPGERLALLERALTARLRPAAPPDCLVAGAWARIAATAGALSMRALAEELGVGERRLQRLFHERVGLAPRQVASIARFRAAVDQMLRHPDRLLGRIALDAGYYDQPHFNREFARLAGVTPETWRREREVSAPPVGSVQAPSAGSRYH
ncbi:MAG: AraC family transcriptional regulator [Gemmatimonadetes bacterium]|nr:AraC family transcriptional regulator [Gemmatimonadota bacterium]